MKQATSSHWAQLNSQQLSWKDTNLEFINSPESHSALAAAALKDPSFTNLKTNIGLQVWRVEKFKLVQWNQIGEFYSGDSYLVLNIVEVKNVKQFDIHFWIGLNSTQDEYGTAAYKAVELDNVLGGIPTIHREVENYESAKFLSYYPILKILQGGIESGFNHVNTKTLSKRLLKISKVVKTIIIQELPMQRSNLNNSDAFILDLGEKIYQLNGQNANKDEKFTAAQVLNKLKGERGKVTSEVLEEEDWDSVEVIKSMEAGEAKVIHKISSELAKYPKKLFRVKEENNNTSFSEIECADKLNKKLLDVTDSFVVDANTHLFVWIGSGASKNERNNALPYATNYLKGTVYPVIPISVLQEGQEPREFWDAFN